MVTRAEWPPRPDDVMSEDAFMQNAVAYAARHRLQLMERLGFGIHGIKLCAIIPTGFRQSAQLVGADVRRLHIFAEG